MSTNDDWEAKHPPIGPTCPCGGSPRKRRVWCRWDRCKCRKCKRTFECIKSTPEPEFIMGPTASELEGQSDG